MNNPARDSKSPITWLWVTVLILLFAITIGWFFNPLGIAGVTQQAQSKDLAPAPVETVTVTLPASHNPPKPK